MESLNKDGTIATGPFTVRGILVVPPDAKASVLFAHGSGCNRLSPRNRQVADYLNANSFATLLFDLLTQEEYGRGSAAAGAGSRYG